MPDGGTNPAANAAVRLRLGQASARSNVIDLPWIREFGGSRERCERLLCFDTRREMNQASGSNTEETNNAIDR